MGTAQTAPHWAWPVLRAQLLDLLVSLRAWPLALPMERAAGDGSAHQHVPHWGPAEAQSWEGAGRLFPCLRLQT